MMMYVYAGVRVGKIKKRNVLIIFSKFIILVYY